MSLKVRYFYKTEDVSATSTITDESVLHLVVVRSKNEARDIYTYRVLAAYMKKYNKWYIRDDNNKKQEEGQEGRDTLNYSDVGKDNNWWESCVQSSEIIRKVQQGRGLS